jgi:hypothetical protein
LRLIQLLESRGLLTAGTALEVVSAALPADFAFRDQRAFRARVGNPQSPRSLVWELDGQSYSVTKLTCKLWVEHGVAPPGDSNYATWRVIGHSRSLWEEAQDRG